MPAPFPPLVLATLLVLETLVAPYQLAHASPSHLQPASMTANCSGDSMLNVYLLLAHKIPGRRQGAGTR